MANISELFTEGHRFSGIYPASRAGIQVNSDWVSMRDYHKAVALIIVGAIAANGIVDAWLEQATDTVGAGMKAIVGKAITPLVDADDNSIAVIELDASELDVNGGFDCIRLCMSHTNAACLTCGGIIRYAPRYAPVGIDNLAEVVN